MNVGPAGTPVAVHELQGKPAVAVNPEFLFLVNGIDDNNNGWIDEGYDGVDNNLAYENRQRHNAFDADEIAEWEAETWPSAYRRPATPTNVPYTIQRRPAPVGNAREISLPTNVVIDMTTWGNPA